MLPIVPINKFSTKAVASRFLGAWQSYADQSFVQVRNAGGIIPPDSGAAKTKTWAVKIVKRYYHRRPKKDWCRPKKVGKTPKKVTSINGQVKKENSQHKCILVPDFFLFVFR